MQFTKHNKNRRICVSGTYGVGKTTTSQNLAEITGIPFTFGRQMRDIIADLFPGRLLENCSPDQIYQLVLTRFADRKAKEELCRDGFISDGSALHEWAYGTARIVHGANGPGSEIKDPGFEFAMRNYGEIAKRHAQHSYDEIVHLPIEFPLPLDGHRPVSESFRNYANDLILKTWKELGKTVTEVRGTMESRLDQIVSKLGLATSETIAVPKVTNGIIHYDRMDDLLGPSKNRYFGDGYKNITQFVYDVCINPEESSINAKVDLLQNSPWSQKRGACCDPHLTSVDAYILFGQLAQVLMYTKDKITREQSNNMWLRDSQLIPKRAITNSTGIPLYMKAINHSYIELKGIKWHMAEMEGHIGEKAMLLKGYKVAYEMPNEQTIGQICDST